MWFEVLQYWMEGNGTHSTSIVIFALPLNPFPLGCRSKPKVYTVVLNWAHGRFVFNGNGSQTLIPIADGYQQIQEPCSANSDFTEDYHLQEMYQSWQIFLDPIDGPKFHLFAFDGSHQNHQYVYFHKHQTCCPPNNSGTPPMWWPPSWNDRITTSSCQPHQLLQGPLDDGFAILVHILVGRRHPVHCWQWQWQARDVGLGWPTTSTGQEDGVQLTPLHVASQGEHIDVVQVLLEHCMEAGIQDEDRWTLLYRMPEGGHIDVVRLLLNHGADAHAPNMDRWTLLHCALEGGHRRHLTAAQPWCRHTHPKHGQVDTTASIINELRRVQYCVVQERGGVWNVSMMSVRWGFRTWWGTMQG